MSQNLDEFVEEPALTLPPGCTPDGITADDHVFAFWQQPNGQIRFVWDGVVGEPFDEVGAMRDETRVFWSDDARHVAYMANRGAESFVGRDGGEEPQVQVITRSVPPTFSTGGAHLVYGADVGGVYRLIIDGSVASEESLAPIAAVYSPDGTRLAFVEMRDPADAKPEERIVLDGVPGPWFRGMRNAQGVMQFSPDSRRFAYYRINDRVEGQWVVDDREQRWVNDVRPIGLAMITGVGVLDPPMLAGFSPDSRRFAYWADVKEKGVAVIEDDVAGPTVKEASAPVFSADSRHLAYAAQSFAKSYFVVVDGAAGKEREAAGAGEPVFSPDSSRTAWTLRREEGGFLRKRSICSVLIDDEVIAEQSGDDMSRWPRFSIDGVQVAWWIRRGEEVFVFRGGESGPALSSGSEPIITSSGHLMYAGVESGQSTVFVDHRPGPGALDWLVPIGLPASSAADVNDSPIQFRVSRDGEHVAWGGVFPDGTRPVIDGRVGPTYDQVLTWSFAADGVATWWTQRGDVLYRVRAQGR